MGNISTWSTTAASNNMATPDGWPEGQAPSTVNDCARAMMAGIRTWYESAQWINYGYTHTYASSTSFTIAGTDYTTTYTVGRRIKAVGSSTGTIYGTITISTFATSTTTITIVWDSGSLSSETLTISLGIITSTSNALPSMFETGDIITRLSATTKTGFLIINGESLGSASSGATYTGTYYQALYNYWYNNVADTYAVVTGGRVSAAADWAANKKLTMPNWANRSLYGVGTVAAGATGGASTQTSTGTIAINAISTVVAHQHFIGHSTNVTGIGTIANSSQYVAASRINADVQDTIFAPSSGNAVANVGLTSTTGSASVTPTGSYTGDATSVLHPVAGVYYLIKI